MAAAGRVVDRQRMRRLGDAGAEATDRSNLSSGTDSGRGPGKGPP
jgi:hypothetical protein